MCERTKEELPAEVHRAEKLTLLSERGICWKDWPDEPWGLHYYVSTRGQDNLHIYIWILKDLSWLQCWYFVGHVSGILALLWSLFMTSVALWRGKFTHAWILVSQSLWLFSNYWWMDGELHDYKYPNQESIYDQRTTQASYISVAALSMIGFFYLLVLPYQKIVGEKSDSCSAEDMSRKRIMSYEPTNRLQHPFPAVFDSWSDYENVHLLFWLGKDCAWIWELDVMWIIFIGPTLFIGVDFVYQSLMTRRMMIDHAHYVAQFIWVLSNAVWASGELFLPLRYDDPIDLTDWNDKDSMRSARWYASWVLVCAYIPLVALYAIWLGGTIAGRITPPHELLQWKREASSLTEILINPSS